MAFDGVKNNIDNLDEVGPDPAVSVSVRPSNWGLGGLCLYFLFSEIETADNT